MQPNFGDLVPAEAKGSAGIINTQIELGHSDKNFKQNSWVKVKNPIPLRVGSFSIDEN